MYCVDWSYQRWAKRNANILVSMIFAGVSGSSQADTAGVGKVLIPQMEKNGYDKRTSVGVTAASSTSWEYYSPKYYDGCLCRYRQCVYWSIVFCWSSTRYNPWVSHDGCCLFCKQKKEFS